MSNNSLSDNSVTYLGSESKTKLKVVKNSYVAECINDCFITEDYKYIHLSYVNVVGEEGYNSLFDSINKYNEVEKIYLETDFIYSLPFNISRFVNLKHLTITGSRFWDLTCNNMPTSLLTLDMTGHSNLQCKCIFGIERIVDLTSLSLDMGPFNIGNIFVLSDAFEDIDDLIPIPILPKLQQIIFEAGVGNTKEDLFPYWKDLVKNNPVCVNTKHRILDMNYSKAIGKHLGVVSINLKV